MNVIPRIINQTIEIAKKYSHLSYNELSEKNKAGERILFTTTMQYNLLKQFTESSYRKQEKYILSTEDLKLVYQGAIIGESALRGFNGREQLLDTPYLYGSVSSVPHIFCELAGEDYMASKEMRIWAVKHFGLSESYIPSDYFFIAQYSTDPQEKEVAQKIVDSIYNEIKLKKVKESETQKKDHARSIRAKILKEHDQEDRKSGVRELFIEELNKLSLEEKLKVLANDTRHSPKYYPANISNASTVEVIMKLDKDTKRKLLEKFDINLKRSPWNKFKNRLLEATDSW